MGKYNDQIKDTDTVKIGNKSYQVKAEVVKGGCKDCKFINRGCSNEMIAICRTGKIFV